MTEDRKQTLTICQDALIFVDQERIDIDYRIDSGTVNVVIINDHDGDVVISDSGYVKNGAFLQVAYIDLAAGTTWQTSEISAYDGAQINLIGKYLSADKKVIRQKLICEERHAATKVDNSCVCLKGATIDLICEGTIKKGAKGTKSHQQSRCLTIGDPKNTRVEPVLYIDENDVEASHSLSCGTVDDEIMFYMNARGLSYNDALRLFTHSYLMPDEELLEMFDNKDEVLAKLEKKVIERYV